jgi:hypothetical protein
MRAGARAPSARRVSGCSSSAAIALASAAESFGGTSTPPPPTPTTSGSAPAWVATTGAPQAIASAAGRPKPS